MFTTEEDVKLVCPTDGITDDIQTDGKKNFMLIFSRFFLHSCTTVQMQTLRRFFLSVYMFTDQGFIFSKYGLPHVCNESRKFWNETY